jgi:hypothetical protein
LGISRLEWAVAYTAIKRALREHVNPDVEVMFDCASPFLATANGTMYTQHVHKNDRFGYVMDKAMDDKRLAGNTKTFPFGSPIGERMTLGDICHYAPGMVNKVGKEGKTSWDSFSYMLLMSHNVYQHIESVQRANALTDMVSATVDTNYKHWRKLKNNSKEEQFSPYVPRNIIYMTQFIEQLFKSETPMQMLDEAGPMLANFNGQKSLTSSTDSFNSLFEVEDQFINETEEMTPEQEEAAEEFLETLEV